MITAKELRQKYLKFFQEREHAVIPSASLIPENDPTCLFISAGMHPLVPYLLGEPHPEGKRLASVQKCIRTGDIDEVGDALHLTFFEMLGNWSLGDYFKSEAIQWSWHFLTSKDWLGLDPKKIYVSVFAGDEDAPRDEESAKIWQGVGVSPERIYYYGKEENWWGPAGRTGPCGPDTEMYYDTGREPCGPNCEPKCNCGKYSEIWNNVFMQYNKTSDGKYEKLKQQNVDTGMGLERTIAILNGKSNVFETELFEPIMKQINDLSSEVIEGDNLKSARTIADHLRAATFIIGDDRGVGPSNLDQGYVVRRLIRKSIRHGRLLGIKNDFTKKISQTLIDMYKDVYPELNRNKKFVLENLEIEENKFTKTLQKGLKEFETIASSEKLKQTISGEQAFELFSTYGFPLEMTQELASEQGLQVDTDGFEKAFKKHQELSRKGSEKKFKGGLADQKEQTAKLHTATHLLHQALRQVLGDQVKQMGSNITAERLRFDFPHPQKMTSQELKRVEDIVNKKIKEDIPIICEEMTVDQAKKKGAIGLFEHKYGGRVKVYSAGDFSCEICGGPHATSTGELGHFEIKKEESSSAGVRRIKAVLEQDSKIIV
ncbi:alanine--tRNA ligase [Patescibacteria group bacterium]|nr:alanine--tRNA ligase [Patescibacteria group bacterium]MBU4512538.1 alanine--tRNA ligase [Patescibacteria group bacterium]MCG2692679.1 alanine--tRNA ligase [Candidatus Parcubacteria bacterium]